MTKRYAILNETSRTPSATFYADNDVLQHVTTGINIRSLETVGDVRIAIALDGGEETTNTTIVLNQTTKGMDEFIVRPIIGAKVDTYELKNQTPKKLFSGIVKTLSIENSQITLSVQS